MAFAARSTSLRSGVALFDRLIGEGDLAFGGPPPPLRETTFGVTAARATREAVMRDVSRLLNTRRAGSQPLDPATATVLDYGIPNFTPMGSLQDLQRFAALLENALTIFEPRLLSPRVHLRLSDRRPHVVEGTVTGRLLVNGIDDPVSFPLALDPRDGSAEVQSAQDEAV